VSVAAGFSLTARSRRAAAAAAGISRRKAVAAVAAVVFSGTYAASRRTSGGAAADNGGARTSFRTYRHVACVACGRGARRPIKKCITAVIACGAIVRLLTAETDLKDYGSSWADTGYGTRRKRAATATAGTGSARRIAAARAAADRFYYVIIRPIIGCGPRRRIGIGQIPAAKPAADIRAKTTGSGFDRLRMYEKKRQR
jgi:hypothetical protein